MTYTSDKLKEEFLQHRDLAGEHGYCNKVFADKIADWWLVKISQALEQQKEMFVKCVPDKIHKTCCESFDACTHACFNACRQEILNKIKEI